MDLDFCDDCGTYIVPGTGEIRAGENSQPVAVCNTCHDADQAAPEGTGTSNANEVVSKVGQNEN